MTTHENAAGAGTPSGDGKFVGNEPGNSTDTPLLAQALRLARDGFHVLPCRSNKSPACKRGLHEASTDPDKVAQLFDGYGVALIGVRTGFKSGVAVLDLNGEPGLAWLARERASLPATVQVITRRGGAHLWYRLADGMAVPPTTVSKIARKVDTRGEGGYAIAWQPEQLVRRAMLVWPQWLTEVLRPPRHVIVTQPPRLNLSDNYQNAALLAAVRHVASAPEGIRNTVLNSEAYSLARLPHLDPIILERALTVAARQAGLGEKEIAATIKSALTARRKES